jgi:LacI family transcriptional regulator
MHARVPRGRKERQEKRSTIKDVAAEAEVSISTVSLVMNDKGPVSEGTRARVLGAAQRLGYVPRRAARQLASQRTGYIGFVLRADHFNRSEPFYTRIFLGSEFEARNQNLYVLLTTIPDPYTPGEHTPRFLREQSVDGVVVAGKVAPAFLTELGEGDVPVVLVDYEAERYPAVVVDNQGGARAAVDHLVRRGHRRIAFAGADMAHPSLRARLDGYRLALAAAGIALDEALLFQAPAEEPTRMTGRRLGVRLFACTPRPTAVFCANDALALGVMDAAREHDVRIPEALSVAGFDDVEGAANASPPLTTVRVFKEQLGELALRYLAELSEHAPPSRCRYARSSHAISVPTELVIRATT